MRFNDKQTQLSVLDSLPDYVKSNVLETIESIPFISNLVSPDRKRAKDLPKDEKGRIIVDLTNPHILEDMDYFRQPALNFKKTGKYTDFYPSRHPNSDYMLFWKKEREYCIYGKVRESDGEWIPGYYYFYLNYSPIITVRQNENYVSSLDNFINNVKRADRIEDFPDVWDGDYLFFHYIEQAEQRGEYGAVLKTRGRGYSFKVSSMLARNYTFIPKSKSYAVAYEIEFLTRDGLLSKTWNTLDWININTPFKKRRLKDTLEEKKSGYKDLKTQAERGYLSEIIGLSLSDRIDKIRGKRGKLIAFEESGNFPKLLKAWSIVRPSLEQGNFTFGLVIAFGTGGTAGDAFIGLETLFYRGKAYRVYSIKNVFDKNAQNSFCGFYHGEYLNRQGCYDKDGNSDVVKALIEIFYNRYEVIKSTDNPETITQEKADRSITPQEACMKTEGNVFPVAEIKEYLSDIIPNIDKFTAEHSVGDLFIDNSGEVYFKVNFEKVPLREFPVTTNKNKFGAIEIFEHPVKVNGTIPRFRYIAGIDSYDSDESSTTSLGSIFIFDLWTDKIVAEYTGRPQFADDFYEICYRLLKYYNALANYENVNKGIYTYFRNKNALGYLCDTPQVLKSMNLAKESYGNTSKGTFPNKYVNAWGRKLQRDWLLESVDENSPINLRNIRSIGYLKELLYWSPEINADRVSAMNMLMILRAELSNLEKNYYEEETSELEKDPFFLNNYKNFYNQNFR